MTRSSTIERPETRISMRIDAKRKAVIAKAAEIRQTTITNFMIENAYQIAREIIASETSVVMTERQFKHFCRVLDRPPAESLRKMKKLLNKKTLIDG